MSKLTRKYLLGIVCTVATSVLYTAKFLKTTELAFVARLAMASEIGNDAAAGDSGVLQSINISSDSPSAISDSFGRSEATAGTKNHRNFLLENWHLLLSLCYSSILKLFTVIFPQGHPKVIINQSVKGESTATTNNQSTRMSNLPESPLVQSHLSATTVLEDGYDSDACQNHNAAIEMEGPQELDEPELGKSWIHHLQLITKQKKVKQLIINQNLF